LNTPIMCMAGRSNVSRENDRVETDAVMLVGQIRIPDTRTHHQPGHVWTSGAIGSMSKAS
jgi:hypothetical protein